MARRPGRIARLLSLRHYRQCRSLFAAPLRAHLVLAGLRRAAFRLVFLDGGAVQFPRYRQARRLWAFLVASPERSGSLRVRDGLLHFDHQGLTVALRPDQADFEVFKEVVLEDVYRVSELPAALDTVVDLGANVGFFTARLARRARRVVALEPAAGNRRVARHNLRGAGVEDRVTLRAEAVGARSGERVRLYLNRENTAMHSILPALAFAKGAGGHEEATTIALRDLLAEEAIDHLDLLKCDVEGAEYDVFLHTPVATLERIERVIVEAHLTGLEAEPRLEALRARLRGAGFALSEAAAPGYAGIRTCLLFGTREA